MLRRLLLLLALAPELGACSDDPAPPPLAGVVVRRDRTPVAGATVELAGKSAVTDGDGRFDLQGVPPGAWLARVTVAGERPHAAPVAVEGGAATVVIPPAPAPGTVDLWLGGDVMFARRLEDPNFDGVLGDGLIVPGDGGAGAAATFAYLGPLLADADLAMINLETAVTDRGMIHPRKPYTLRSSPDVLTAILEAGVDLVGMANNHVFDYTDEGIGRMLELVDEAGLARVGAGRDFDEAATPYLYEANGVRIAIVAATSITGRKVDGSGAEDGLEPEDMPPYYTADPPEETGGVPKPGALRLDTKSLDTALGRAAAANPDLTVLVVHGGTQYSAEESPWVRQLARHAIDLGVDLVVGHHPHVLQGIEVYRGVPIVFSVGNLIFDQKFIETFPAVVVEARGHGGPGARFDEIAIRPIWLDDFVPRALAGADALAQLRAMAQRSARLGTTLAIDAEASRAVIVTGAVPTAERRDVPVAVPLLQAPGGPGRSAPVRVVDGLPGAWFVTAVAAPGGVRVDLGRDLLASRGFGDGEADDDPASPTGWTIVGAEKQVAGGVLRLERSSDSAMASTARSTGRMKVVAGRRLTLLGRWRSDPEAGLAAARIAFYADRETDSEPMALVVTQGRLGSSWTDLQVDLTVPEGARYAQVELAHVPPTRGSRGAVEYDDIGLIAWAGAAPASDSVAATDAEYVALEADGATEAAATVTLATSPTLEVQP